MNFELANNDCMKELFHIKDNSIDCIITDPPYKVTARGNCGTASGICTQDIYMKGKVFEHNDIDCEEYAPELFRVLKNGGHCYVMTNHVNLIHFLNTFTKCGFHFVKSLIWDKRIKIMGLYYMSQFEYILFFRKGTGVPINNCGTSDILSIKPNKSKNEDGEVVHPTEKPVELMRVLVENSTKHGDIVLDPFMGVGSTGVACIETGRRFVGFEINEQYFKIADERISEAKNSGLYEEQMEIGGFNG